MSIRRLFLFLLVAVAILLATAVSTKSNPNPDDELVAGRNVNMVSGTDFVGGDPYLQRQNEPSIAVSTRNPMHLLAAANDYRTIDWPESEGPLPGITQRASSDGDAWLGIYKSYNSGQSWTSTLLPGYPQDITAEGKASPLYGYSTACDPTVRAGSSGLFFTSGIAFNRAEHGGSAIFVARYIDNNTQAIGDMDSIKYLDVSIIDEGTSGQFADKPWIAVDAPTYGSETVRIPTPDAPVPFQNIPRFNVYIVYSIFLGSVTGEGHSKIMFARSTDSGRSWEKPIKLSETVHVCQGTNIAVSPQDGKIYVVWRQYEREEQNVPHAIVICTSNDMGAKFTKATEVEPINPFDQYTNDPLTNVYRFRTSAFPALAVDPNGVVYVAWSERGVGSNGEARIVIKTSDDGKKWTKQKAVDNHGEGGHQIMPSLTCAGGKLMMTWYDTRKSLGYVDSSGDYHHSDEIADPGPTGNPHTLDVWVAQAEFSNPPKNPDFTNSIQASRYLYQAETNVDGSLVDPPVIYQAQFSFPNFPIFIGGTGPFMGDYIDITPAPMFLYDYDYDNETWRWRFNTGEGWFDPTLTYITFACNRDVIPPSGGLNWTNYWPPGSEGNCSQYTAGMRNQNIYSASVNHGIMVGAPVNTKPLWIPPSEEGYIQKRTFLVFVKNLTDYEKLIRLTIDAPIDMDASFWETGTPPDEECPFELCEESGRIVEVNVLPYSSITLTVFVGHYELVDASFRVNVEEIDEEGNTTGLRDSVVLNPDPVNTQLIDPNFAETHNPILVIEDPDPMDLSDPTMLSDSIVYTPYLEELLNFSNPDIVVATSARNPRVRNPRVRNDTIINPRVRNSALGSYSQVTDLRWTVINEGNTISAYSFEPIGETPSVPHQLLIHRVTFTPVSPEQCVLAEEEHHELLLSNENPRVRNPRVRNPRVRNPRVRNNTFFLAPGEEAVITLRLIELDPDSEQEGLLQSTQSSSGSGTSNGSFDPEFYAKTVAGAAIPQAANPNGEIETAAFMWIYTTTLPDGSVNDPYPLPEPTPETPAPDKHLEAEGGDAPYSWALVPNHGDLPPGLTLDSDGLIHGEPSYNTGVTYPKTYNFAVQATDSSNSSGNGQQTSYRSLSITVECIKHTITATTGEGGTIDPPGSVYVINGFNQPFTIDADLCFYIKQINTGDGYPDKDFTSLKPDSYTYIFDDVRANNYIEATFESRTFTITPVVVGGLGGTIESSIPITVECDSTPTFKIIPDSCFHLVSVEVGGNPVVVVPQDGFYTYTFLPVRQDYEIKAVFAPNEPTITATAGVGGSIDPSGQVPVNCPESQTFIIRTDIGYQLVDVLVDGNELDNIAKGPVTSYTFYNVQNDHTIEATFKKLEAWVKRYNNNALNGDDEASDIAVDPSGNSFVTGFSLGGTTGPDFYTIGYESDGNVGLSARYDGPSHEGDKANAITADGSGNVYVTGFSYRGQPQKHSDYSTVKYNSSGELVWDDRYDARRNGNDVATAIAVDDSGYVYVTGKSEESLSKKSDIKHYDYYTIKYDPNKRKSTIWGKRYNNDSVNGADEAAAIAVDSAGNVYVTGRSEGSGTGFDIVTLKYLPNGNVDTTWGGGVARYHGGSGDDEATGIAVDSAGNVYVTGRSEGNGAEFDYVTIKYFTNGTELWAERYNNSVNGNNEAVGVVVDAPGNVYVTGRSQGSGTGYDYVTIKYDSTGNLAWDGDVRRYDGGYGDDEATGIAIDSLGDVYVTGKSQGSGTGSDYHTIKYDSSGNLIWRVRYNNSDGADEAVALVIDSLGNVYVTGKSQGNGTGFDFATVKYIQHIE